MIKKITDKTIHALLILASNKPMTSREFAILMWPNDGKWKLKSRRDRSGGHSLVYAGGNYLARLYVAGYVLKTRWRPSGGLIKWTISDAGINLLSDWSEKSAKKIAEQYITE